MESIHTTPGILCAIGSIYLSRSDSYFQDQSSFEAAPHRIGRARSPEPRSTERIICPSTERPVLGGGSSPQMGEGDDVHPRPILPPFLTMDRTYAILLVADRWKSFLFDPWDGNLGRRAVRHRPRASLFRQPLSNRLAAPSSVSASYGLPGQPDPAMSAPYTKGRPCLSRRS